MIDYSRKLHVVNQKANRCHFLTGARTHSGNLHLRACQDTIVARRG